MKTPFFSIFIVFLIIIPVSGFAITLEEALQEAMLHSQEMKMAEYDVDSAKAQANELVSFTLPQISLRAGHAIMGADKENPFDNLIGESVDFSSIDSDKAALLSPGDYVVLGYINDTYTDMLHELHPYFELPEEQDTAALTLSQVIFSGGNVWRSWGLRKNLITQADLAKRMAVIDIRKNVKSAFHKVLFQDSYLKILKDRVAQCEEELNDARDLLNAGLVTSLDLRNAKLKINIALNGLKEAEVSFRDSLIDFNTVIGRSVDKPLLMPKGMLDRGWKLVEKIKTLEKKLSEESLLSFELIKRKKEGFKMKAKMAAGEYLPKLALLGGMEYTNNYDIEEYTSWTAGAQLSWDLFKGGAKRSRRVDALSAMHKADEELTKVRKETGSLVSKLTEQAKTLNYRIDLQQEAVSIAAENYNDARSQYRAGTLTQTQMGEFHLAYSEARFGLLQLYFMERELEIAIEALLEE
ncbi:MAG: TolC family protein [Proteobacteria bacterium]|nr:TolC family protein [Pseudomonadota bacterium]